MATFYHLLSHSYPDGALKHMGKHPIVCTLCGTQIASEGATHNNTMDICTDCAEAIQTRNHAYLIARIDGEF